MAFRNANPVAGDHGARQVFVTEKPTTNSQSERFTQVGTRALKIFNAVVMYDNFFMAKKGEADLIDAGFDTKILGDVDIYSATTWVVAWRRTFADEVNLPDGSLDPNCGFEREIWDLQFAVMACNGLADEFGLSDPKTWQPPDCWYPDERTDPPDYYYYPPKRMELPQ